VTSSLALTSMDTHLTYVFGKMSNQHRQRLKMSNKHLHLLDVFWLVHHNMDKLSQHAYSTFLGKYRIIFFFDYGQYIRVSLGSP
jgi:hypothetical protein